jgi:phosphoribosylanthranilate isomerase
MSENNNSLKIPRVKICCIASVEEAKLAIKYGASAIGLISEMPSGPGSISEGLIEEIAATIPPGVSSFLLTSKQDVDSIIDQQKRTKVNTIQLVDKLNQGSHSDLKKALPGISLVQVIHVLGEESIQEAIRISGSVNGILLDTGNPSLKIKELGGTGRVHDWEISRRIVQMIRTPVFLAGGLKAENVVDAVNTVHPFGLDLCNGVRTKGKLDEEKLSSFFSNLKKIN